MGARGPRPGRRLRRRTGPAAGMATTAQPREAYHDLASRPLPRPAGSDPARPAALRQLAPAPRRRDPRDGADLHGVGSVGGADPAALGAAVMRVGGGAEGAEQ